MASLRTNASTQWLGDARPASAIRPIRLAVLYYIEQQSGKFRRWRDGFTGAIELLNSHCEITWLNIADQEETDVSPESFDFVLVKSNWRWHADIFAREWLAGCTVPRGIMISGSIKPPRRRSARFYDVLFFQTRWYEQLWLRQRHPVRIHAYGVDTRVMHPPVHPVEKRWDWLFVGKIASSKRPDFLLHLEGSKAVVTDIRASDQQILTRLIDAGVEVHDFVPYEQLRDFYWAARCVYVPATVFGGGERPVMEGRACGTPVRIERDNAKLQEVLDADPVWDERYYAQQLLGGIWALAHHRTTKRASPEYP